MDWIFPALFLLALFFFIVKTSQPEYKPPRKLKLEDRFDEPCDSVMIEKAIAGDKDAQLLLALEYCTGRQNGGVDFEKAYNYLMLGRKHGLSRFACYLLAGFLFEGLGVDQDKEHAIRSMKTALAKRYPPVPPFPAEWLANSLSKLQFQGFDVDSPVFRSAKQCRFAAKI